MKSSAKSFKICSVIIALAVIVIIGIFFSCDAFKDSNQNYKIFVLVTCGGSTTAPFNEMTVNYYIDKQTPFTDIRSSGIQQQETSFLPPKKITTITVTVTKATQDSTVNILIYKMSSGSTKIVKYANLPGCTVTTLTSCTNTITLDYDVNADQTKAAAGNTTSSTSSSSTSSTSSSSSGM